MQFPAEARIGPYQVVRLIGAGGMGEVYLAHDTRLAREVALKVLPAAMAADPDRRNRFMREARAASRVTHPNAAAIFEVGESAGVCYIAMEYVAGETLAAVLKQGPMKLTEIVRVAASVVGVLDAAHGKGVTHRDLKPGNLIVGPGGEVKLLDFGLAKIAALSPSDSTVTASAVNTEAGMVMGTVSYMSPEQALGHAVDGRSDIFSFGVMLYEMLAGQRPFDAPSATETIARILSQQPVALARLNYDIPLDLERIVRKCLEKDRENRYQSAREILVDLRNLRQDSAAPAPAPHPPVAAAPARRWMLTAAGAGAAAIAGAGAWLRWGKPPAIGSLAVLPLVNAGAPEQDYLADGVTETLINQISQVRSLRVMSRSAVYRLTAKKLDPLAAGQLLQVGAVLAGRLQTTGDGLSLSVELMETAGRLLWGKQFKTALAGLLPAQETIVREVLAQLGAAIEPQERKLLAKQYTASAQAYELFLKGRYFLNKRTMPGNQAAIEFFEKAIDADPSFALPHTGLADCYSMMSGTIAPREMFPKAKAAALHALELDETLSEAHSSLAFVKFNYDWDWLETERELKRASQLNPSSPQAHSYYARFLSAMGRYPEALAEMAKARELDPLALGVNTGLGLAHYFGRNYAQAIEQYKNTLALDKNFLAAHFNLAAAYVQTGQFTEAVSEFETALKLAPTDAGTIAELGQAYALMGKPDEARRTLARVMDLAAKRYVNPSFIAWVHAGLGERDTAMQWLRKGYDDRSWPMVFLKVDPKYDLLRTDPRFTEIQRLVGL